MILDSTGTLYGAAAFGGLAGSCTNYALPGCGVVFKLDKSLNFTLLYSFTGGADGATPGGLLLDRAGNLYGTTSQGGLPLCQNNGILSGCGTVFKLNSSGEVNVLYSFGEQPDGQGPVALIRDKIGNLYGTTGQGGDPNCSAPLGCGTVFQLSFAGKETILHRFHNVPDGRPPTGDLLRDAVGNLYGTTIYGGDLNCLDIGCGVIFKVDAKGKTTVIHTFLGADGGFPMGGLLLDKHGNLYGTTFTDSGPGTGVVFKLATSGTLRVLHRFKWPQASNPNSTLIMDAAGNFYGTTAGGGDQGCPNNIGGCGVVFQLGRTGHLKVLHAFTGGKDGSNPTGVLLRDAKGNLYGTTRDGGVFNAGVIFKIPPH